MNYLLFTYEELKPWLNKITKLDEQHLLFTYEELKPFRMQMKNIGMSIYYLPMRN